MLRNLASALILTERDAEFDDNAPKVKGRIVTTVPKAKEVRPLVEKCVTIARRSLPHQDAADELSVDAERGSDQWKSWRKSDQWQKWNAAVAPAVAARRRVFSILRDKQAVQILFDDIAPRFKDRPGGYTRILKLATPRLGDAGARAILEFVGVRDRVATESEKPAFDVADDDEKPNEEELNAETENQSTDSDAEAQAESTSETEASSSDDQKSE